MSVFNRDFIGREFGPVGPYEVSREKIRDYALATGDPHPVYLDPEAARAAGYPDVIAPPSFPVILFFRFGGWPLYDPEFGKRAKPICVHRAQSVSTVRPIHPGDLLVMSTKVTDITEVGPHDQFDMTHTIDDHEGATVSVVRNCIISRHVPGLEAVA
ncbi:FAS1-like dehydratase domain-containing protein [Nocardia arizonensis]|uniref:FAS1-like dehydratase domain-containing protein n=1 Tax=Nocardia arizonensis TaxID=1141647 RepID=UPI0006D1C6C6|nr:MaoC family dehydratase N-terminal domain-containing protein [Nocardia arizonensis]